MEGYIDNEDEMVALDEEESPEDLVLTFGNKPLSEYEAEFTIKLPAPPCSSHQVLQAISDLGNAYGVAYNCAARLIYICAKAEKDYKIKRTELVAEKIASLKEQGAKKLPSKETIEAMVMAESDELEELVDSYKKWHVIKDWFDAHVKKLSQLMAAAKDISYGVNSVERVWDRTQASLSTGPR